MSENVSPWVQRYAPLVPGGEVLDVACGTGRHSRHMVTLGHAVVAVDHDVDKLAQAAGPGITTTPINLEEPGAAWPFGAGRFAGIVVTNYLHRPSFAAMAASLAPNGVLLYETFADGNAQFGKPSNPDFLLQPGELLALAAEHGLRVVAFEDGLTQVPQPAMVQRLCAVKAEFPRTAALLPPW